MARIRSLGLAAGAWLTLQSSAWAQDAAEAVGERPYVGAYAVVFLLVVLGLLVVCRGSGRTDPDRAASRFED